MSAIAEARTAIKQVPLPQGGGTQFQSTGNSYNDAEDHQQPNGSSSVSVLDLISCARLRLAECGPPRRLLHRTADVVHSHSDKDNAYAEMWRMWVAIGAGVLLPAGDLLLQKTNKKPSEEEELREQFVVFERGSVHDNVWADMRGVSE